jgi:hypothetical protein
MSTPFPPRKALLRAQCRCFTMAATNPHYLCFVCLGLQHARGGLTDPPECPSCTLLSLKERKQRWVFFRVDLLLEDAVSVLASGSEASYDDGASGDDEMLGSVWVFLRKTPVYRPEAEMTPSLGRARGISHPWVRKRRALSSQQPPPMQWPLCALTLQGSLSGP